MRKIIAIAALCAAGTVAWIGLRHVYPSASAQSPDEAEVVPVTAGVAEIRDMPVYVRGIGSVQPFNTVSVKSRVDGQIVKVDFTEGQEVKVGDPLFEIDPRPFQAALSQAEANKEKDAAQLVSAEADLKRYTELVSHGFQTRQIFDQQKALVGQLGASLKADQAQIDAAQLNLTYANIRSPIDGRTGARLVDIGNLVHAADTTGLVTVTQLRPIFVSFTVPQREFDTIRTSQTAAPIDAQAFSEDDRTLLGAGKLTLIDNQIDQATGTLHLKARFDNQDEALWPGAFVNMRLVVAIKKSAVTVPARAILRGPNGAYLFAIKADNTVEMRRIEVSITEQDIAVVEKGLAAGTKVVVDGQYRLDEGTKVIVQPPNATPS